MYTESARIVKQRETDTQVQPLSQRERHSQQILELLTNIQSLRESIIAKEHEIIDLVCLHDEAIQTRDMEIQQLREQLQVMNQRDQIMSKPHEPDQNKIQKMSINDRQRLD